MYFEWSPYVSVAEKLAKARKYAQRVAKKEGRELSPVAVKGRKIGTSFWGRAWCDNLDRYSDFANRLPRGRRYLGNGSVVDLQIHAGQVKAIVAGSETYRVTIKIKTLPARIWKSLRSDCARSIHSLIDLLQGRFDEGVMRRLAQAEGGLFPHPREIDMNCSCPDYARVCKHIAAVIYGVGVRFDVAPELLFTLRSVDHSELISEAVAAENLEQTFAVESRALAGSDLGELFGIELAASPDAAPAASAQTGRKPRGRKARPQESTPVVVTASSAAPGPTRRSSVKRQSRPRAAKAIKPASRKRRVESKLTA
jgi:uncharacterized Zn finger protein